MVEIPTPALAPAARRTLLDAANVSTDIPAYALFHKLAYDKAITDGANRDIPTDDSDKIFDKRDLDDTTELQIFTAYRGADEPLLNGPGAYTPELEKLFEAAEPIFVEEKVQKLLLSPNAVDITPTPGTAVKDLDAALGLLEQWIATRYQFQPVISGNLLAVDLIQKGRPAALTETVHGTVIASAAGFGTDGPGAAVSGAGQAWLYISGQINIWKGPANVQGAPDPTRNRDLSLVEKSYAVSLDGPVAAILVGF
jgi:hypothetical protein